MLVREPLHQIETFFLPAATSQFEMKQEQTTLVAHGGGGQSRPWDSCNCLTYRMCGGCSPFLESGFGCFVGPLRLHLAAPWLWSKLKSARRMSELVFFSTTVSARAGGVPPFCQFAWKVAVLQRACPPRRHAYHLPVQPPIRRLHFSFLLPRRGVICASRTSGVKG